MSKTKTEIVTETRTVTRRVEMIRVKVRVTLDELIELARPGLVQLDPAFASGVIEAKSCGGYCEHDPDILFIVDAGEVTNS